jgi:hypothetical protein
MTSKSKKNELSTTSELMERLLFTNASTMEEYMDKSNIGSKIKSLSMRILWRRLQKRQRTIGGFRSKMVIGASSAVF